ncbi:unnamed protein product [Prorocentrum cordatum]|uniref:MAGE domain-containing protein n=1 Tax=Prorocentrum cordatum TaxID=2364126 RepID=A0ABN9QBU8_9DINO|nr:unnamed protein product [Polarella glacialis]
MDRQQLEHALSQARAAGNGGGGAGGDRGRGAGGRGQTPQNDDANLLTMIVRDHLYIRQDMGPVADRVQLAVLFKTNEESEKMTACVEQWKAKLPENTGPKGKKARQGDSDAMATDSGAAGSAPAQGGTKHPFGPKKVFLLFTLFARLEEILQAVTPAEGQPLTDGLKQQGLAVLKGFKDLGQTKLDTYFTGFSPKIPTMKKDFTWLWVLTINQTLIPPEIKSHLVDLISLTALKEFGIKIEVKRSVQGKPEADLWTALRGRPRA